MRVLYVEDNRQLREAIHSLLVGEGREVAACETAEEALALDTSQAFDLVITDVTLPGMSGLDLCRRITEADHARWVVLCTGHILDNETKALGPNVRTLIKPFGLDELETLVSCVESDLHGRA